MSDLIDINDDVGGASDQHDRKVPVPSQTIISGAETTIRMRQYVLPLNSSKRQLLRRGPSVSSLGAGYSSENTELSELEGFDELPKEPTLVESASTKVPSTCSPSRQVLSNNDAPAPVAPPPRRFPSIDVPADDNSEEERDDEAGSSISVVRSSYLCVPTQPQGGQEEEEEEKVEDDIAVKKQEASRLSQAAVPVEIPGSGYITNKARLEETQLAPMPAQPRHTDKE